MSLQKDPKATMVIKKFKEPPDIQPLQEEFNRFSSVRLINSTKNILEKIFWLTITISGTIYIGNLFVTQVNYWNDNPILVTKGSKPLSEVKAPAVTFCHKGVQKYTLVERLLNHIDIKKNIPKEIFDIRNIAIESQAAKISDDLKGHLDICDDLARDEHGVYYSSLLKYHERAPYVECNEFGKKSYLFGLKYSLDIKQIHEMILGIIVEQRLWNITEALVKIEKVMDINHLFENTTDDPISSSIFNFIRQKCADQGIYLLEIDNSFA